MNLPRPLKSQLTLWRSLEKAKARREAGLLLAEGFKVASELLKSNWKIKAFLIMEEKKDHWRSFLADIPKRLEIYTLTAKEWEKLSQDKNSEGIMAVAALPPRADISNLPETGHILLAYGINNPNNLGALMRTAHWFGFTAILLSRDSVDHTNPKVVRTSMGSLFHLTIISDVDFIKAIPKIKERFFLVASSAKKGNAPHSCPQKTALLMGSESHGLPDILMDLADEKWHIPGVGGAESLSLPQAAAIMMYEASKQNA
jgi:TrmH family RNA methyltransferase